jgi:hypothetical protein
MQRKAVDTRQGHAARRASAVVNDLTRPAAALRSLRPVQAIMNPYQLGTLSVAMQARMDVATPWSVTTMLLALLAFLLHRSLRPCGLETAALT